MGIRKYKPTSAGRRQSSVSDYSEITRTEPEKSLLQPLKKTGGRNNQGQITSRRRGGVAIHSPIPCFESARSVAVSIGPK